MPLSSQEGIQCTQWILIELRFLLLAKTIAALERVTYFIKLGISVSDTNFPQGHAEIVTLHNEMTDKFSLIDDAETTREKKAAVFGKKCYQSYRTFYVTDCMSIPPREEWERMLEKAEQQAEEMLSGYEKKCKEMKASISWPYYIPQHNSAKNEKGTPFFFYFPASFQDSLCLRSDWSCDLLGGKGRKSRMYNFRK